MNLVGDFIRGEMKLRDFLKRLEGFDLDVEVFQHGIEFNKLEKIPDIEVMNILVSKDGDSEFFVIDEESTNNTIKGILIQ